MAKITTVDDYLEIHLEWRAQLELLRNFLNNFPLQETIKWGAPVFTYKDKNFIGLAAFKNHYALWFFQGSLLKENVDFLHNAQEGKTKTLRQIRFNEPTTPNLNLLKPYINEMMEVIDSGQSPPKAKPKKLILTPEFIELFESKPDLEVDFATLPPGKQREYISYISDAKRESTRRTRMKKIIPLIKQRKGLNDKYRNY